MAVTTLEPQQSSHRWPFLLPDGQRFLFYALGAPATAGIYLGALDGSAPTRLMPADSAGVYLSEGTGPQAAFRSSRPGRGDAVREGGWLLWVRAGTLTAQRMDLGQNALTGEPVALADGVAASGTFQSALSVAANGLVAYRNAGGNQRQLTWVDRSGTTLGTLGAPDENNPQYPSVSPDGRRVAVTRKVQGNTDLWLMDGARLTRFTFDAGVDQLPIWWPDGSRIVFNSNRTGQFDLYQQLASGTAVEDRLVASDQFKTPTSVAADGRFLLYFSLDPQTSEDLWIVPVSGDRTPFVFLKTPFRELSGVFSPDGRWVAYMADQSGRMEIYVRPFTAAPASGVGADVATGQWQISTAGGVYPQWRSDGKELFYVSPAGDMMAATITARGATLEAGAPVTLFPRRIFGGRGDPSPIRAYDVARDGRFVINAVVAEVTPPITLLMNWRPDGNK